MIESEAAKRLKAVAEKLHGAFTLLAETAETLKATAERQAARQAELDEQARKLGANGG